MSEHKKVMEAALFISSQPLTLDQLARVAGINSLGHVKELVEELQRDYEGRGLEIFHSSDGYCIQVRPKMLPKVAHLTPYSDLGEGPKRTLALVTLKEPVKQSEIIKTQGNKAYSYIKDLKKRGLILTEKQGHTKIIKLTQEFERYFGEEKGKIKEQLERHLQATSREGEPVYEEGPKPQEGTQDLDGSREFLDDKPVKPKAKSSVIKEEASRELPAEKEDRPERGKETKSNEGPGQKQERKARRVNASHNHAFQEIE